MSAATTLSIHFGTPLTAADESFFSDRWITLDLATAAGITRVSNFEGRELMGVKSGSGDYSGYLLPNIMDGNPREYRVRRLNPDIEIRNGHRREIKKYVAPPGTRNFLYAPPFLPAELLNRADCPLLIVEGELKGIAAGRLSTFNSHTPRFAVGALSGVWNFRGVKGKLVGPNGERRNEKGPIPDLDRIELRRKIIIAYDSDASTNESVQAARATFTRELRSRGATVAFLEWNSSLGKGLDDFVLNVGPEKVLEEISAIDFDKKDWQENLIRNRDGSPKANLANAITALREAPEFAEILAYNEFSLCTETTRSAPWGSMASWTEHEDRLTADWLQRKGINVSVQTACEAVQVVAKDHCFHPVKRYLESVVWDSVLRLKVWLHCYLGASTNDYTAAVGERWMVSAVARIFQPAVKADCVLILEGPQGIRKSTALETIAGEWFTDELADLGSKDAALQTRGVWIIEIAELDSMSKGEISKIKAFISRATDRFRPPYGKRVMESPRQCIFAGSVNHTNYLRDETGGRRFWPVACGAININDLRQDRDQLWAEAVHLYRSGVPWWLDTPELVQQAEVEQGDRYECDPWASLIAEWVQGKKSVSIKQVLEDCIQKKKGEWGQADQRRVSKIFRSMDWRYRRIGPREARDYVYERSGVQK